MSANNDMEILMQQKFEEFRIEPSPADWNAIYEKLHPKKDRHFFWLWFTLVAGLLFGGYWFTNQDQFSSSNFTATVTDLTVSKSPAESKTATLQNKKVLTTDPAIPATDTSKPVNEKSSASTNSTRQSSIKDEKSIKPIQVKRPLPPFSSSNIIPTSDNANSATTNTTSDTRKPPEQTPAYTDNNVSVPVIQSSDTEIKQIQEDKKETPPNQEQPHKDSLSALMPFIDQTLKKKSIPNLASHNDKGWYLGAYAELGVNKPTEPISMAKAADLNSSPVSGSITTSDGSSSVGLHYAFGLALERKLKKIFYSFGLGIQSNSWSFTSATYKDSIVGGNFYNRTQISNNNTTYTHLALELPIMLNFRIAGKKHSSYWFTTGLNNAITLKLDQKTDVSLLQSNAGYSQDNSLSSKATSYQPQFRIGLTYEHTQNQYHWQLSPFMQYGLNRMVKSGDPDIHMLHLGLQARYYFKRLK